jgi:hypothetical protein
MPPGTQNLPGRSGQGPRKVAALAPPVSPLPNCDAMRESASDDGTAASRSAGTTVAPASMPDAISVCGHRRHSFIVEVITWEQPVMDSRTR